MNIHTETDDSHLNSNCVMRTVNSGFTMTPNYHRVSGVMREVQNLLPDLSTAELSFKEEMSSMSRSLKSLKQDAEQLHQKLKFQNKTGKNLPSLSDEQQDRVRAILKEK